MAVTPYSAALFPTSYFCTGVRNEFVPDRPGLHFSQPFNSTSLTFTFASTIAAGGTVFLNGALGSGRSGFSLKGRKYFKIDIAPAHFFPVNVFGNRLSAVFKCKFGWVKLWRIASDSPNSPKFSPATVLHYTVPRNWPAGPYFNSRYMSLYELIRTHF